MPHDWRVIEWEAFQLLHEGGTYIDVARRVGRSPSTLKNWVTKWRERYGPEVFVSSNEWPHRLTPEQIALGNERRGELRAVEYGLLRADMARSAGVTSDHARATALEMITNIRNDPVRMAEASTADVLNLARAFDIFARRADLLADIPSADRAAIIGSQTSIGEITVDVDLSGLEAASEGSEVQETLRAVDDVLRRFQRARGDDVIDVESSDG